MDSVALAVATVHLAICPFTKVEESFNIQALHDIFYHGTNISQYDHLEFPGVVPRTFLGSLIIALISSPFYFLLEYYEASKFSIQLLVRCALGSFVIFSWTKYKTTIEYLFGEGVARWLLALTISQFHFMFYLSRTLPNIMALPFVMLALHAWLRKQHTLLLWMSAICVVVFRVELVLFLGLLILFELFYLRLSISRLFLTGIPIGVACLTVTSTVDSYFWQRLIWPEGEVLYFNTVLNGSVDYGTHPFFWYFYSAIPRAMGMSIFFIPSSLVWDTRIRRLIFPAVVFVFFYSFLPHKELRFIIYVFPVLNVAAAYTCNLLWTRRSKSFLHKCVALGVLLHILMNFVMTYFLLSISSKNYPGGVAISTLHKIEPPEEIVNVHIDNYAAQTGVTRFTQLNPSWSYNKTEYLKPGCDDLMAFTHLIVEAKSKYSPNLKPYVKTHNIISIIETFSHLQFNYVNYLHNVVKIKTKPILYILKRKDLIRNKVVTPSKESGREKKTSAAEEKVNFDKLKDDKLKFNEDDFDFHFNQFEDEKDGIVYFDSHEKSESPSVIKIKEHVKVKDQQRESVNIDEEIVIEKKAKSEAIDSRIKIDKRKKGESLDDRIKIDKETRNDNGDKSIVEEKNENIDDAEQEDSQGFSHEKSNVQSGNRKNINIAMGKTVLKDKEDEIKDINKQAKPSKVHKDLTNEELRDKIKERIIYKEEKNAKEQNKIPLDRKQNKLDEKSKGEFVVKNECTNCNENTREEIEIVKNDDVKSVKDKIKKKIIEYKLKEKLESKTRINEEDVDRMKVEDELISSDEFIEVEDE